MGKKKGFVQGVGINDADYIVSKYTKRGSNGRSKLIWSCPYYVKWKSLLQRCYDYKFQERNPSYVGCTVSVEWLTFSNFRGWMASRGWEGLQLDKDLLYRDNKVYSEDTCLFLDKKVNNFPINSTVHRGDCFIGCHLEKKSGQYKSQCQNPFTLKEEPLGRFTYELDAHLAWKTRKHEHAIKLANSVYVTEQRVRDRLLTMYAPETDWTGV